MWWKGIFQSSFCLTNRYRPSLQMLVKYAVINEPRQQVSRIQEEVIKFSLLSFENNSDLV